MLGKFQLGVYNINTKLLIMEGNRWIAFFSPAPSKKNHMILCTREICNSLTEIADVENLGIYSQLICKAYQNVIGNVDTSFTLFGQEGEFFRMHIVPWVKGEGSEASMSNNYETLESFDALMKEKITENKESILGLDNMQSYESTLFKLSNEIKRISELEKIDIIQNITYTLIN